MRFFILGAGGVNSYFGTKLISLGPDLNFVARGKYLESLQQSKLKLQHPDFFFEEKIFSYSNDEIKRFNTLFFNAVSLTTKTTSTITLVNNFNDLFTKVKNHIYIISFQNEVDNKKNLSSELDENPFLVRLIIKISNNIISLAFFKLKFNFKIIFNKFINLRLYFDIQNN